MTLRRCSKKCGGVARFTRWRPPSRIQTDALPGHGGTIWHKVLFRLMPMLRLSWRGSSLIGVFVLIAQTLAANSCAAQCFLEADAKPNRANQGGGRDGQDSGHGSAGSTHQPSSLSSDDSSAGCSITLGPDSILSVVAAGQATSPYASVSATLTRPCGTLHISRAVSRAGHYGHDSGPPASPVRSQDHERAPPGR